MKHSHSGYALYKTIYSGSYSLNIFSSDKNFVQREENGNYEWEKYIICIYHPQSRKRVIFKI